MNLLPFVPDNAAAVWTGCLLMLFSMALGFLCGILVAIAMH
jgi:hypothetical protein